MDIALDGLVADSAPDLASSTDLPEQIDELSQGEALTYPWDDDLLVVMSFNVMCSMCTSDDWTSEAWAERVPHFGDVIQRHSPDLIGLQEVTFGTEVDEILAVAPGYLAFYPADLPPNLVGWTEDPDATILYREDRFTLEDAGFYWLSDTPETPWSTGWASTNLPRVLSWARLRQLSDGRSLYFATTHFDNNYPNQEHSATLVMERFSPLADHPIIFVGDFNSRPDTPAYATLTSPDGFHFSNAFDLADTWSSDTNLSPPPPYDPASRIDHIFLAGPAAWSCTSWTVDQTAYGDPQVYPSDHFPVVASLAW